MAGGRRRAERPVVECRHGGRHAHGTPAAYSADGCRCEPCTAAKVEYMGRRRKLLAYGRWEQKFTDPAPARAHVLRLREAGIGYRRIAELAGLKQSVVQALIAGRHARIAVATAESVLSVPLTARAAGAKVDGTGSRRRVQALAANGWSMPKIAAHVGVSVLTVQDLAAGAMTTEATAAKVRAAYDRLWDAAPPAASKYDRGVTNRIAAWAAAKGFLPPLAWDDETIDDPAAEPAGTGRKERRLKPGAELVEDVEFLHRTGATPEAAAKRLGMKAGSISDAMRRQGRPDLGAWITGWVDSPAEFKSPVRKGVSAPRQSSAA